jgi:hypothetical protein
VKYAMWAIKMYHALLVHMDIILILENAIPVLTMVQIVFNAVLLQDVRPAKLVFSFLLVLTVCRDIMLPVLIY